MSSTEAIQLGAAGAKLDGISQAQNEVAETLKSQLRARRSASAGAFRPPGNKARLAGQLMRRDWRSVCY
jgi:hypothetical protein